jgi:hypothetical protein
MWWYHAFIVFLVIMTLGAMIAVLLYILRTSENLLKKDDDV